MDMEAQVHTYRETRISDAPVLWDYLNRRWYVAEWKQVKHYYIWILLKFSGTFWTLLGPCKSWGWQVAQKVTLSGFMLYLHGNYLCLVSGNLFNRM